MQLSDVHYRALVSKDTRFDGVFFVGVKSTGIYCRTVCPARTPKRSGCLFFRNAVEAEKDGFRACFRCRPELAPGHATVDAVSRLGRAAVAHINAGFLNGHSVEELAVVLGVTGRHLRRIVHREFGATPTALAQSRRLAMAKQLLHETSLGMTEVAFASGFSSVRRFNAVFQERFERTPSSLRRAPTPIETAQGAVTLRLDYRPPLQWDILMEHCHNRLMQGVENVENSAYYRTVSLDGACGWLCISKEPKRSALKMKLSLSLLKHVIFITMRVRRRFDLDAHPNTIAAYLQKDTFLQPMIKEKPGLRVPGAFDAFAQMIRIILGQRISVKAATTLCNRLIKAFGTSIKTPYSALTLAFPEPSVLATCPIERMNELGIPDPRAQAIQDLAKAVVEGEIPLEQPADVEQFSERLLAIKGIGPWTVRSIRMRILGEPDSFPASDLELRKALGGCSAKEAAARAEIWRPWRAYAAAYLWNRSS